MHIPGERQGEKCDPCTPEEMRRFALCGDEPIGASLAAGWVWFIDSETSLWRAVAWTVQCWRPRRAEQGRRVTTTTAVKRERKTRSNESIVKGLDIRIDVLNVGTYFACSAGNSAESPFNILQQRHRTESVSNNLSFCWRHSLHVQQQIFVGRESESARSHMKSSCVRFTWCFPQNRHCQFVWRVELKTKSSNCLIQSCTHFWQDA